MVKKINKNLKNLRWCARCHTWHRIGSKIYKEHRDSLRIITK